jgi:hypothetical protein
MDRWAADYITIKMNGPYASYKTVFGGLDISTSYDVSLVTKNAGVITAQNYVLDTNKIGALIRQYDTSSDTVLIIRNSGITDTANPSWNVSIEKVMTVPPVTVFARNKNTNSVIYNKLYGTSWIGWEDLGGILTSDISAISSGSNITIFARGADNGTWTQKWNGTAWSGWTSLGGIVASDISATSSGSNITIFARGADNGVWTRNWNGAVWSGWLSMGGITASDPTSISVVETYLFIRGIDNGVWYQNGNGSVWSGIWQGIGGLTTGRPEVAI